MTLVCDMPHPHKINEMIQSCVTGNSDKALLILNDLWTQGFSAFDIIGTLFKVTKTFDMAEYLKLEYIKVGLSSINIRKLELVI